MARNARLVEPGTLLHITNAATTARTSASPIRRSRLPRPVIVDYAVYAEKPADSGLLAESVQTHRERLARTPRLVAGDAGLYSAANERALEAAGVKRISVPNRRTKSVARRRKENERWFKQGQRWRTGGEGRISVLKRRHGLNRSRYRGQDGMEKWVGLGVIADNPITLGGLIPAAGAPA